jgi:hypothetical protein
MLWRKPPPEIKKRPAALYESQDARTALPQNCSPHKLPGLAGFENATFVPFKETRAGYLREEELGTK